jgi:hypothetical protein
MVAPGTKRDQQYFDSGTVLVRLAQATDWCIPMCVAQLPTSSSAFSWGMIPQF